VGVNRTPVTLVPIHLVPIVAGLLLLVVVALAAGHGQQQHGYDKNDFSLNTSHAGLDSVSDTR